MLRRIRGTFDDRFALVSNSLTLQFFTSRFGFGFFDSDNFVGFAARFGGFRVRGAAALMSFIASFTFLVGNNIGDQNFHDGVTKTLRDGFDFAFHGFGDGAHLRESFVERHAGNMAKQHVENVGFDLRLRIREFVEGVALGAGHYLILHGDGNFHEDVVFRFCFHIHGESLHARGDHVYGFK